MTIFYNRESNGGTELLSRYLEENLDSNLLENFDIISSRIPKDFQKTKPTIFWSHDLPGDPECDFIKNLKLNSQIDKYVFVSDWQQQAFLGHYYPYVSDVNSITIPNFVFSPKDLRQKNKRKKLVYYSTPHRGLTLLYNAVTELKIENPELDFTLDVFSSYDIYNQQDRNKEYEKVFQACIDSPFINYHKSIPHDEMLKILPNYDIFAYPSIWFETSCLCLLEAMSFGLECLHPNLAALPESSCGLTNQYQFNPDSKKHIKIFKEELKKLLTSNSNLTKLRLQQNVIKQTRSPDLFLERWKDLLTNFEVAKKESFVFTI
jgi:hypothetical protein